MEELEIRGRMEIIQNKALLRSTRILRRVLERKLAVTLTPVKDHQLTLVWKTHEVYNNNNIIIIIRNKIANVGYMVIETKRNDQSYNKRMQQISAKRL